MSDKALDGGALPVVAPKPIDIAVRLRKTQLSPAFVTGVVLLTIVVLAAIFAPLLTPYDPIEQRFTDAFLPPLSPGHVLGTDNFGRDIWSRIVYSARLDLQIGLISVLFPFFFGSLMGIATGYLGGSLDTLVMRVVDVLMAFPFLILVTAMVLAILTGATLSFLGLGPQPPTPEWGAMIAEGRQFLLLAWWMTTLPGMALLVVGVGLSLIGDGLAERRGGFR